MSKEKYVPPVLTDEKLKELEDEHEDVLVLRGTEIAPWCAVVRRPNRKETIAYKSQARRDPATANETLIRLICLFPRGDEFQRMLDRWPFLVDGVAQSPAFNNFIGLTVDEQLKT